MGSELLKMADGFAMIAESIRAMAALQIREAMRFGFL